MVREEAQKENRDPPAYTMKFRVQLLRDGLSLNVVQKIAGLLQGGAQSVKAVSMAETCVKILSTYDTMRTARGGDPVGWRTELLRNVYEDTGKSSVTDGPVVCKPNLAVCSRWEGMGAQSRVGV